MVVANDHGHLFGTSLLHVMVVAVDAAVPHLRTPLVVVGSDDEGVRKDAKVPSAYIARLRVVFERAIGDFKGKICASCRRVRRTFRRRQCGGRRGGTRERQSDRRPLHLPRRCDRRQH